VASLEGGQTAPSVTIQGGGEVDTGIKLIFASEFINNTVQTALEGGESCSGDETTAEKSHKVITFQRTMTKKGRHFFEEKIG